MKSNEYFEVVDIVEKIFNIDTFEDYFNQNVSKYMQPLVLNECVGEIKRVLSYCFKQCEFMLPSEEKDVILIKNYEMK